MGLGSMHERSERLVDPIAISVPSGTRVTYALAPGVTAFRIKRSASSAGTLRYVARVDDPASEETAGYALTEDDPDSGWILADASRYLRVYAEGGDVAGEGAQLSDITAGS